MHEINAKKPSSAKIIVILLVDLLREISSL